MLTAPPLDSELFASADKDILEIRFLSVVLNPARPVLVAQMLTAPPLEGQPYASASKAIQEIHTQTVALTPAQAIPAVRELSVKTMAVLPYVNVPHNILEIRMCPVDLILAMGMLVDQMLTAPEVAKELCAPAEAAILAALTAGPDVEPIPVLRECVGGVLSVKM